MKIQEKSAWKMCIGYTGSLETITFPTTATTTGLPQAHLKRAPHNSPGLQGALGDRDTHCSLSSLKNGVLQLPLCEKTISVNIHRVGGRREGLLCTSAPANCCQVI